MGNHHGLENLGFLKRFMMDDESSSEIDGNIHNSDG